MKNIIESIPSPLGKLSGWERQSISGCGHVTQVIINTPMTDDEKKYAGLVARTNFFQLIRMAVYMNEGLTFRESVIKYLRTYEHS
jgi:hypothetical protein